MKIPLIKPYITPEVKDKVCDVLDSGYLTEGPVTEEFEELFKKYIGCKHAIAVTNCTNGLEIALRVLGIGSGDEVIVPDYTYPATADVAPIVGAKSVIVDVCKDTMLIDYDEVEKAITDKTKAIIPVSEFGNPLDYDRLNKIKEKYGIYIVEDSACSIGAEYKGIRVGNQADISVFSLHPRKFITTGEGGMIATNNSKWADWMKSYKHFGMEVHNTRLETNFVRIGSNYKMSNILAAVGLIQLKHIDSLLNKREELSNNYINLLKNNKKITIPKTTDNGKHSHQSFAIFIDNRDEVMKKMRNMGIEVQIGTYSLHMHKGFYDNKLVEITQNLNGSEFAFKHCLTLPLYHELSFEQQQVIVKKLEEIIK